MSTWGLVVPVKRLALAKTRLRPYDAQARRALTLAMAQDVVAAALSCREVGPVLVVSSDPEVAQAVVGLGARTADEGDVAGLDRALEHGARLLREGAPASGVAAITADLPALRPDDLAAALAAVAPGTRAVVPDAAGTGTTLLAAAPGCPLEPAFGPGSLERHTASGARRLDAACGLRLDVDTPQDLARALGLGVGPRTAAVAAGLP